MVQTAVETRLFGSEVSLRFDRAWVAYWTLFLRLVMGWYFLHVGLEKYPWALGTEPFNAAGWLGGATQGTLVYPLTGWAANTPWVLGFANVMIPLGQTLIGLGLLLGVLVRLASFFGAFLMFFFYFGNADWEHGFVNGDLLALLLFATVIVWGAGRVFGVDAWIESTDFVRNRPWFRYLLG